MAAYRSCNICSQESFIARWDERTKVPDHVSPIDCIKALGEALNEVIKRLDEQGASDGE